MKHQHVPHKGKLAVFHGEALSVNFDREHKKFLDELESESKQLEARDAFFKERAAYFIEKATHVQPNFISGEAKTFAAKPKVSKLHVSGPITEDVRAALLAAIRKPRKRAAENKLQSPLDLEAISQAAKRRAYSKQQSGNLYPWSDEGISEVGHIVFLESLKAILTHALPRLHKPRSPHEKEAHLEYLDLWLWVRMRDDDYEYSFESMCKARGHDPDVLRARLEAFRKLIEPSEIWAESERELLKCELALLRPQARVLADWRRIAEIEDRLFEHNQTHPYDPTIPMKRCSRKECLQLAGLREIDVATVFAHAIPAGEEMEEMAA